MVMLGRDDLSIMFTLCSFCDTCTCTVLLAPLLVLILNWVAIDSACPSSIELVILVSFNSSAWFEVDGTHQEQVLSSIRNVDCKNIYNLLLSFANASFAPSKRFVPY